MNELKPTEAPAFPPSPNWFLSSIASCNSDGLLAFGARNDVYILDLRTQLVTRVLQGHTGRVTGTAFCDAQSGIVASCSADQSIILWNTSNGSIVEKVKEHSAEITCIAASPNRSKFLVSGDKSGKCVVWSSGTPALTLKPSTGQVTALALHPSKVEIGAFGYNNGSINIVNLLSGHVIARLTNSTDDIQSMAFSPSINEPALLAYTSKDKSTGIVSLGADSAKLLRSKRSGKSEGSDSNRYWATICWLNSDTFLLSKPSGDVFQLDLELNMHKWAHVSSRTIFQLVHSTDSNMLACIAMDRKISTWDAQKKSRVWELSTLGGYVYQMAESPVDKSLIAMACGDNSIRIWCSHEFFSSNRPADASKRAKTTNVSTSLFSTSLIWKGISAKVTCICWSNTSVDQLLFGMDDGRLVLHSLERSHSENFQRGHKQAVYGVCFLKLDGPRLGSHMTDDDAQFEPVMASVGGDGEVLLHASPSSCIELNRLILTKNPDILSTLSTSFGKALKALPRRTCFDFSPQHSHFILGNADGTVELYSWPTLQLHYSGRPHERLLNKVKWHPSDPLVAFTASEDGSICAFGFDGSFATASVSRLLGHTKSVYDLAASTKDSKLLASSSADGTVRVWNTELQSEVGYHRSTPTSHPSKLFSVLWSSYNENAILFGGDDQSVSVRPYASSTAKSTGDVKGAPPKSRTKQHQELHKPTENPERRVKAPSTSRPQAQASYIGSRSWISSDPLQLVSSWLDDSENSLSPAADPSSLLDAEQSLHSGFIDGEDVSETILKVIQAGKLNDAWVAWSASGGFPLWRNTCATYAAFLASKSDFNRSVYYYCAIRDFEKAIMVFEKANMFQDAISLASSRLPTGHPRIKSTWSNWANHLAHRCQHPQAARSFAAAEEYEAAVAQLQLTASTEALVLALRLLASHCANDDISRRDSIFWDAVAISITADLELSFLSLSAMGSLSTVLDLVSPASRYLFVLTIATWHALKRDCGFSSSMAHRPAEATNFAEMAYLIGFDPNYASTIGLSSSNDCEELRTSTEDLCLPSVTSLCWNMALSTTDNDGDIETEKNVQEVVQVAASLASTSHPSICLISAATAFCCSTMLPLSSTDASQLIRGLCQIGLQGWSVNTAVSPNLLHFHRMVFSYLSQTTRARKAITHLQREPNLCRAWELLTLFYSAHAECLSEEPTQEEASATHGVSVATDFHPAEATFRPAPPSVPLTAAPPYLVPLPLNAKKRPPNRVESAANDLPDAKRSSMLEEPTTSLHEFPTHPTVHKRAEDRIHGSPMTKDDVQLLDQVVHLLSLRLPSDAN